MRLYTAIDIPDAWRTVAVSLRRRLAGRFEAELRFVAPEQLHVTVRFLGEVDDGRVPDLVRRIEAVGPLEIELDLEPAGTFGSAARTNVVWLGVAIDDAGATRLLGQIDRAISEAGLRPPETAWRPHLTLARVRRQAGADQRRALADAVRNLPPPASNRHLAPSVSLYRSDLGNSAPRHELLARSAIS